jgi:serine/threonine protein phosphatase PrpC
MRIEVAYLTHRGANPAYNNQDALLVGGRVIQAQEGVVASDVFEGDRALLAVADGVSASPQADKASHVVLELLQKNFDQGEPFYPEKSLRSAQEKLLQSIPSRPIGASATVAGLALEGGRIKLFNAGDSKIYRFRSGKLEQMSCDHTVLHRLIKEGEIDPQEAEAHGEYARLLDSCLMAGTDGEGFEVSARSVALEPSCWLLCTDGLSDFVPTVQMAALLDDDLVQSVQRLFDAAMEAGGEDNVSIVLVRVAAG